MNRKKNKRKPTESGKKVEFANGTIIFEYYVYDPNFDSYQWGTLYIDGKSLVAKALRYYSGYFILTSDHEAFSFDSNSMSGTSVLPKNNLKEIWDAPTFNEAIDFMFNPNAGMDEGRLAKGKKKKNKRVITIKTRVGRKR